MRRAVEELFSAFGRLKIAVIGDPILDEYIFGRVERISPEAPVPVFEVERNEFRAGGAANVALNLKSLGVGRVLLLGRVGRDEGGRLLKKLLEEGGVETKLLESAGVPTTRKTRLVARSQQLIRIDEERRTPLGEEETLKLFEELKRFNPDAVVVSDYAKGVVTETLGRLLRDSGFKVFVDPRPQNLRAYRGLFCVTPNLKEFEAMARRLGLEGPAEEVAPLFRERMGLEALVITLSERGIALFTDGESARFPATAREVYDVTGAGDTVAAALSAAYAAAGDWHLACRFANLCAGVAVSKLGTAQVRPEEVLAELSRLGL
ncbi:MAG: D-glycero-beta-D-manno-heptose-7-phosphate kinase [Aquificae bacterium]|nr:D-glycero-beta-D-manno-heptose-7-phosphate kinase [Aquificota bacterium]